jgi:2-dehydropantoate 2-reductase
LQSANLREVPITVVGAGAIGGTIGAYLGDSGYDITLVDVAPEHVEAVNERGLRITGARGDKVFRPRAVLAEELKGPLGVIFLCVKSHFTEDAMDRIEPLLAPDSYVLSLQNGLNETSEHVARSAPSFISART